MVEPLTPRRGGFIKPLPCGLFIRDCLMGKNPNNSPHVDPVRGACQEDLFVYYKTALHTIYAEAAVDYDNEHRVRHGRPIYTEREYRERVNYHLGRTPYRLVGCRYHSFQRYCHMLKQLGWIEFTAEEEPAAIQEYHPQAPPRRYYRLTRKALDASEVEWSNPQLVLYPKRGLEYFRSKRKEHNYSRRRPAHRTRA